MQYSEVRAQAGEGGLFRGGIQDDLFPDERGFADGRGPGNPSLPRDGCDAPGPAMLDCYSRVRGAVVCMHTAARLHGLLAGASRTLWLGAPLRVHVPRRDRADLRVIRWSNGQAFEVGVEEISFPESAVRCTSPERTLVDLVRYGRHAGGTTTAVRCARAYFEAGGTEASVGAVADALRISRPARVILETLLLGMGSRP